MSSKIVGGTDICLNYWSLVCAREFGLLEAIVGVGTAMVVLERDDGETCCAVISLHFHCTGHHTADLQTLTVEGSPSFHFSQR